MNSKRWDLEDAHPKYSIDIFCTSKGEAVLCIPSLCTEPSGYCKNMTSGLFGGDIEQSQFHVRLFFQAIKTTLVVKKIPFL